MLNRLRHWILPNRLNNYHPHILRPLGLGIAVLVIAFIPSLYNLTTANSMQVLGYATNISVGDLHAISNTQRTNNGIAALGLNGALSQAATAKAQHMFANNYWAHTAPDGTSPWTFISNAGYSYTIAGENLAKNFSTSAGVVNGWMNSPSHRANVLKAGYTEVGYGVVNGTLQGEQTTLVVALYAAPYVAPAPAPAPPEPAPAPTPAPQVQPQQAPAPTAPVQPVEETPAPAPEPEAVVPQPTENTQPAPAEAAITPNQTAPEVTEQTIGQVAGVVASAPIKAYQELNWGQKASLFILSTLALLFIMKHTLIWRTQKRGVRGVWLRSHPLAQASFLVAASVVTLLSGTGTIL